jgi:hypothetical protein
MPPPIKEVRIAIDPNGKKRSCLVIDVEHAPPLQLSPRTLERIAAGVRGLTLPCTKFSNLLPRKP